jgi:hypothetical protein
MSKEWTKNDYLKKKVKVDTYWKKENRETENKTERRRA